MNIFDEDTRNYKCCSFILQDCPTKPEENEVFYIEAEYDKEVNDLILEHLQFIKDYLSKKNKTFFFLPGLSKELLKESSAYYYPGSHITDTTLTNLQTNALLKYLYDQGQRKDIKPGFARRNRRVLFDEACWRNNAEEYNLFYIDKDLCGQNPEAYLAHLCDIIAKDGIAHGLSTLSSGLTIDLDLDDYQRRPLSWTDYEADVILDDEALELSRQLKEIAQKLHAKGVGEFYIRQLVGYEPKLSRLVITKDYKIILPDFNNMEIQMEPMNKAVYLLYLRHPQGIAFKNLIDYRQELLKIYLRLWTEKETATIDWERIDKAIDNICNPLSNSINEKTSRIKKIFLTKMHEDVAKNYYIAGGYGASRKIGLSEDMIEWQTPDSFNCIEKYYPQPQTPPVESKPYCPPLSNTSNTTPVDDITNPDDLPF